MANPFEQEYEARHLETILSAARSQLAEALRNIDGMQDGIADSQRELFDEVSRPLGSLWSSQNFHELVEVSQFVNPITVKLAQYELQATKIASLKRMLDSPYFARIDFTFDGESDSEEIYIGRSSLTDEKTFDIYVYDWRSPVASVFYRFGTGEAFYDAPQGRITGEVTLKRQFEIRNGKLEYFFDADRQILDEFLRKLLSENTSAKMKTIVETIQRDQDIVIRDMENTLMMVQGVAGSGKTSIGLHRVAYLMYQGLSSKLSANNIIVISPNTLFEQYIANVLPELGEENVVSAVFEELFTRILGVENIQPRNQFLETLISCTDKKRKSLMKRSMEFKASGVFAQILDRLVEDLPRRWLEFSDVDYGGQCIAARQQLKSKIINGKEDAPLSVRLKRLERSLLETVHERKKKRVAKLEAFVSGYSGHMFEIREFARMLSIIESTALVKGIRRFTEIDYTNVYRRLFGDKALFHRLAKGLILPDCIDGILDYTHENLSQGVLPYEDALTLSFLHVKLHGEGGFRDIRQVVLDEAQDYYPLHFELLRLLFPRSKYTVLGDIDQTIEKQEGLSFYENVKTILNKDKATLITMDKSFRCTKEILRFGAAFLGPQARLESFNRGGDEPEIHSASDEPALDSLLVREVETCREKGYGSIALVCKTQNNAVRLYGRLKERLELKLADGNSVEDLAGTFVIPLILSKGLEFDAVLLCDADSEHYSSPDDEKLLYICCTRALHRLNLFHTGTMSPLLKRTNKI